MPLLKRIPSKHRLWILAAALLAGGCGSAPADAGFGDVQKLVAERTGHHIEWNRGSPADASVSAAVRELLAGELRRDAAVQISLLENRHLQALYADLGVAQADLVEAGLLSNPLFSGSLKFFDGPEEVEFDVVQSFLGLFAMPLRRRVAGEALEAAKLEVAAAVVDHVARVESRFVEVQAGERALELRRQAAEADELAFETARRLRDAGNISELELGTRQLDRERARLDLREAEARLARQRERLTRSMGLQGEATPWRIAAAADETPLREADPEQVETLAVHASLDLAARRHRIAAAAERAGFAGWSTLLADAEAGIAVKKEPDGGWGAGPALTLPVPLFDQGQGRRLAAEAGLARLLASYTATAIDLRSEARGAREWLRAERERARLLEEVMLPLEAAATAQAQLQYNAMQIGSFDLLAAKRREIGARVEAVEAARDEQLARIELERILRGGRVGDLTDSGPAEDRGSPSRRSDHP